jgi:prolyl-tRNA editing enzyme YbaK/EbsC (Cys-tRNA(Pro) deacylase)
MNLPESVRRVADALAQRGHAHAPRMLDASARTAQEAADALGVQLGQIAKSIVFRREPDQVAVMVVTSGDQRVDERKLPMPNLSGSARVLPLVVWPRWRMCSLRSCCST